MELAGLTKLLPAPASAEPILFQALAASKAVSSSDETTLADAVNATSREWRESIVDPRERMGSLCPINLALCTSLDTEGLDEWLPVYRKACDVPGDLAIHIGVVARQAYRESLFIRSMKG
jgi:hypothetical protein